MVWDPQRYAAFLGPRTRAAADLCARIPTEAPREVVDAGCGPGNSTEVLLARFPAARVRAFDSDPAMVSAARARLPGAVDVSVADVTRLPLAEPVDVIFSNAVLHWVDDHASLFPALAERILPGGTLAVQMPRNFAAPSHTLLREIADRPEFRARLAGRLRVDPVASPAHYADWLPPGRDLDLWETEYVHRLEGDDPVLGWIAGSALVPIREALDDEAFAAFTAAYGAALREAYPRRSDGSTFFPFRRLFIVWQR